MFTSTNKVYGALDAVHPVHRDDAPAVVEDRDHHLPPVAHRFRLGGGQHGLGVVERDRGLELGPALAPAAEQVGPLRLLGDPALVAGATPTGVVGTRCTLTSPFPARGSIIRRPSLNSRRSSAGWKTSATRYTSHR